MYVDPGSGDGLNNPPGTAALGVVTDYYAENEPSKLWGYITSADPATTGTAKIMDDWRTHAQNVASYAQAVQTASTPVTGKGSTWFGSARDQFDKVTNNVLDYAGAVEKVAYPTTSGPGPANTNFYTLLDSVNQDWNRTWAYLHQPSVTPFLHPGTDGKPDGQKWDSSSALASPWASTVQREVQVAVNPYLASQSTATTTEIQVDQSQVPALVNQLNEAQLNVLRYAVSYLASCNNLRAKQLPSMPDPTGVPGLNDNGSNAQNPLDSGLGGVGGLSPLGTGVGSLPGLGGPDPTGLTGLNGPGTTGLDSPSTSGLGGVNTPGTTGLTSPGTTGLSNPGTTGLTGPSTTGLSGIGNPASGLGSSTSGTPGLDTSGLPTLTSPDGSTFPLNSTLPTDLAGFTPTPLSGSGLGGGGLGARLGGTGLTTPGLGAGSGVPGIGTGTGVPGSGVTTGVNTGPGAGTGVPGGTTGQLAGESGLGGMYPPMMPGMGMSHQDEQSRSGNLLEEHEFWGVTVRCTPPVIGLE